MLSICKFLLYAPLMLNNKVVFSHTFVHREEDADKLMLVSVGEEHGWLPYNFSRKPGWHSEHLIYTLSGRGLACVDGKDQICSEGSVLLTPKNLGYSYRVDPQVGAWKYLWVEYDGGWARQLLEMSGLKNRFLVENAFGAGLALDTLFEHAKTFGHDEPHRALALFFAFFAELEKAGRGTHSAREPLYEKIEMAKRHIAEHLSAPMQLDDLAGLADLSRFHFARLFKQHTGMPPMTYVRKLRIAKAKELLRQKNLRVGEVGAHVGFPDIHHFTAAFKKETGHPPSAYRH